MPERMLLELPDPAGETYEDGSRDLIISGEWPALYPTRHDHVDLHIDGCDVAIDERALSWLIEDGGPQLLAKLRAELAAASDDAAPADPAALHGKLPREGRS